jgi:hypothetical protein
VNKLRFGRIEPRSTVLTWYTADEPDGSSYALNSTKSAYEKLKELVSPLPSRELYQLVLEAHGRGKHTVGLKVYGRTSRISHHSNETSIHKY